MNIANPNRKPKKIFRWIALALLLLGLCPYLYSRFQAPRNRVQQFDNGSNAAIQRTFDRELSIVSFNIAHGRGTASSNWAESGEPKRQRIGDIAAELKRIDADIVILNEVDFLSLIHIWTLPTICSV